MSSPYLRSRELCYIPLTVRVNIENLEFSCTGELPAILIFLYSIIYLNNVNSMGVFHFLSQSTIFFTSGSNIPREVELILPVFLIA